ncbi:MAG: ABC transporter ATP-binding protein [Oscillospiraceae bacterium]|nr:ABC transporter ATP-binding protein [Oscillospiraceae bacterium]
MDKGFYPIIVKDLTFSYGSHSVLNGVSFSAERGEVLAVLGPNGVGKSTLFHCILGFHNCGFGGEITICGESVKKTPASVLAKRVAYVPQSHAPTFNYTVLDMVLMGTSAQVGGLSSPGAEQLTIAEEAIERVGISHLAERGYTQISGGERQLCLVARALAQKAKILVMDEPTANLDFGNQIRILSRIQELTADGYSIILSTHSPEHAKNFSDRVLAINNGTVEAVGVSRAVITEELICSLYNLTTDDLRRIK